MRQLALGVLCAVLLLGALPGTALMASIQYSLCSAADNNFETWLVYDSSTLLILSVDYHNGTNRNGDVEIYHNGVQVRQVILPPGGKTFDVTAWNINMINTAPTKAGPAIGLPTGFTTGCGWPAP